MQNDIREALYAWYCGRVRPKNAPVPSTRDVGREPEGV
jgi:hypothetical protein